MKRILIGSMLALGAVVGCSGDDDEGSNASPLPDGTACEKWRSLSNRVGCAIPEECNVAPACEATASAWMDCTATDLSQCLCETDLDLNCEGSHKPNEGPALCQAEFTAFNDCVMANP